MSAVSWQVGKPQFSFSALSSEYVQVPVTATLNGSPYDPASDTVSLAFKQAGVEPSGGDWQAGTWTTTVNANYLAQILVGPAGQVLAEGTYVTWVKITDSPSVPVSVAGTVTITP